MKNVALVDEGEEVGRWSEGGSDGVVKKRREVKKHSI